MAEVNEGLRIYVTSALGLEEERSRIRRSVVPSIEQAIFMK